MNKLGYGVFFTLALALTACGQPTIPSTVSGKEISPGIVQYSDGRITVDAATAMISGSEITVSKIGNLSINSIQTRSLGTQAITSVIGTAPQVDVSFSNGETFSYDNISGVAVYDGDIVFGNSTDMPRQISSYEKYVNPVVAPPPGGPGNGDPTLPDKMDNSSSLSPMSSIGKRGYICSFQFIWCWAGFTNTPAWPNKTVYYKIASNMSGTEQALIQKAVNDWNSVSNNKPKWTPASVSPSSIATTFYKVPTNPFFGGLSPIGYTMQKVVPYIFISQSEFNSLSTVTIIHEMGHASGLNHEHQRCDRDKYITLNISGFERIFNFTNWNKLCVYGEDIGPFDYDSIMLYRDSIAKQLTSPKYTRLPYFGENLFTGIKQTDNSSYRSSPVNLSIADVANGLRTLYP